MCKDLSSAASACGGLNVLDAHVRCMEILDVNYRCEREGRAGQNTRQIYIKESKEGCQKGANGQTAPHEEWHSNNRRNKNRIRKRFKKRIYNTVRSDWPKEEKERELAWLHAQLWKYQRGTFAPPAA